MFDDMVVSGNMKKTNKPWAVIVSSVVQALILGILILIPLISYSELPKNFNATYLAAPPPPPPPPKLIPINKVAAPTVVPKHIEMVKEAAPTVDFSNAGVAGGTGDAIGGLGNLLGGGAAPPPPPKAPTRVRVGGNVEQASLVRQTMPIYPAIAKTAHVQGTVVLHAIIGKDGAVQQLEYVSGPSL